MVSLKGFSTIVVTIFFKNNHHKSDIFKENCLFFSVRNIRMFQMQITYSSKNALRLRPSLKRTGEKFRI